MTSIVIRPPDQELIQGLGEQVEVHNVNGELIGYFMSRDVYSKLLYGYAKTLVSDDELDMARRQDGGRSTNEILERLKNMNAE